MQLVVRLIRESLALAYELDDKNLIALSFNVLSYVALKEGDLVQAWAYCQDAMKLARELGDRVFLALQLNTASNILLREGSFAQAETFAQESLTLTQMLEDQISNAHTIHTLGDIEWRRGDAKGAKQWFQEGFQLALRYSGSSDLISWYVLGFARVAVLEGLLERAARLYRASKAQFDLTSHMDELERKAYEKEVSALCKRLGEKIFKTAWEAGYAMTREQIQTACGASTMPVSSVAATSPAAPDDLTMREKEVIRLLATGLTNIQIAKELVISPLTVNAHVRSIYSKLGVTTRAAATRYAFEHHLL